MIGTKKSSLPTKVLHFRDPADTLMQSGLWWLSSNEFNVLKKDVLVGDKGVRTCELYISMPNPTKAEMPF